jgi:hypothetical protein
MLYLGRDHCQTVIVALGSGERSRELQMSLNNIILNTIDSSVYSI